VLTVNGSLDNNRLVTLGAGVDTIYPGLSAVDGNAIQRFVEGQPTAGYWQRPLLTWSDKNSDGVISPIDCGPTASDGTPECEVSIGDNPASLGNPLPKRELSVNTNLTLLGYVRVGGVLDHRGGYKPYNATEPFRCVIFVTCRAAYDKRTPLFDHARRMRTTDLTLMVSGRNLPRWRGRQRPPVPERQRSATRRRRDRPTRVRPCYAFQQITGWLDRDA